MYFRYFEYLQSILEEGSFPAAARRAGVSQPAISLAMQSLERFTGVTLFERSGRQKIPTREAHQLAQAYGEFRDAMDGLQTNRASAIRDLCNPETRLRLGISSGAACIYGAAIADAWKNVAGSKSRLSMFKNDSPELISALQRNQLDLVITPRPRGGKYPGLHETPLFSSTPAIYARLGHPLAQARSLAELKDVEWAVVGRTGTPGNMIAEAHRVRKLPDPMVRLDCADYISLLHAVANSDMMGVVPHAILVGDMAGRKVQALHVREGLPRYEVCVYRRAEQTVKADRIEQVCVALERLA